MVCAVVVGPSLHAAVQQIQRAENKALFIELRIDAMDKECEANRSTLFRTSSQPKILTFRRLQDGGKYKGSEVERQQQMLQWAGWISGRQDVYMDLEEDLDITFFHAIQTVLKGHKNIILSYHNGEKNLSDEDLETLLGRMQKRRVAFYKIAVQSHSIVGTLQFLSWAKRHVQAGIPLISVSMGELGEPSRILSRVLGFPFTYGFFEEKEGCFRRLIDLYRVPFHTSDTRVYGLIGDPITGSIGHIAHNQFFQEQKMDAVYLKMRVRCEELEKFLQYALTLGLKGLSVTMPLKEKVLEYLDGMDPFVQRSGAANTLVLKGGKWWGYNTDGQAIVDAVAHRTTILRKKVLVLGTGGVAKAAVWAARAEGACIDVMGRNFAKARALADSLQGNAWVWGAKDAWENQEIILNCTPEPFPTHPPLLSKRVLLVDLRIQSETDTRIQAWQNISGQVVHGKEIFYRQANLQRDIWFG